MVSVVYACWRVLLVVHGEVLSQEDSGLPLHPWSYWTTASPLPDRRGACFTDASFLTAVGE